MAAGIWKVQSLDASKHVVANRVRKCADTTGTVPVPGLAICNDKI